MATKNCASEGHIHLASSEVTDTALGSAGEGVVLEDEGEVEDAGEVEVAREGATPRGMEDVSREVDNFEWTLGDSVDGLCEEVALSLTAGERSEGRKLSQDDRAVWSTGHSVGVINWTLRGRSIFRGCNKRCTRSRYSLGMVYGTGHGRGGYRAFVRHLLVSHHTGTFLPNWSRFVLRQFTMPYRSIQSLCKPFALCSHRSICLKNLPPVSRTILTSAVSAELKFYEYITPTRVPSAKARQNWQTPWGRHLNRIRSHHIE
jgi:hypothetical protein